MEHSQEPSAPARSWLQRLKEESWEAEWLVSTVSIYGTFQLFDYVKWIANTFIGGLCGSVKC